VTTGALAVLIGACSAGLAGLAASTRADPAIGRALVPLIAEEGPGQEPTARIVARLGRLRWLAGSGEPLRHRLDEAGNPWALEVVQGWRVVLSAGGVMACLLLAFAFPPVVLLTLPVGATAYRCPDLIVAGMAKRRRACIAAQVPDLGELLLATTRAGLSPPVAFRRSADVLTGPLGDELHEALRKVDLGHPWRSAMGELAERVGDPSLRRLLSALGRTQRLGTSVVGALRTVMEDLRSERRTQAEERARRAPVKMLFPLVFLILPAFLLLTVGPVVLATIRSLR
jgi:tight adherence protein C